MGFELSKWQLFKVVELGLDGLIDLLFDIEDDVELAGARLEHLSVTSAEHDAFWVVVEEPIQVFKLDLVHGLQDFSEIFQVLLGIFQHRIFVFFGRNNL